MKFEDIPADVQAIRVMRADGKSQKLEEQPVLSVVPSISRPGEFEIRTENAVVYVCPVNDLDIRNLNSDLSSGRAVLAQLANPASDGSIELQIAYFLGECLEIGEVDIGVDDYVTEAFDRIEPQRNKKNGGVIYGRLKQHCCFHHYGQDFFFLTAGPAIDRILKSDADDEKTPDLTNNELSNKPEPSVKNSFCVTGDGIRFVATPATSSEGKSIYTVTRLTKRKKASDLPLRLAKGKLKFSDQTNAGGIRIQAKAQIASLTEDDGSYLKKWDEFGALEGEHLLARAREVGDIQYHKMTENRDGTVSVRLKAVTDAASEALGSRSLSELDLVDKLPTYLVNRQLKFADYVSEIVEDKNAGGNAHSLKAIAYDVASKNLTIAAESLPAESGSLIMSLAGDITQIKRRHQARRSILEGTSANSQLGLLIEEAGRIAPIRSSRPLQPLTGFVRNKVFHNPPTVMQEKAIDVALNTPDIAIIQGPPGTGKTTVIAAILERLNEMADKRGGDIKGRVLLTGFQHDAVENMIDRISLNGLPVPKFGRRSGTSLNEANAFERSLEEWCQQMAMELREQNPKIAEAEHEAAIRGLCLQYIHLPTRALAVDVTKKIASLGVAIIGEDCLRKASRLVRYLTREELIEDKAEQLLDSVRRIRTYKESFLDDGPERATDALDDLETELDEKERDLLDRASLWRGEDGNPTFLPELRVLKKKLLIRLSAPPVFRVDKQNDAVIALVEEAIVRIRDSRLTTDDLKVAALAEFVAELEDNPRGVVDAVSDYSFAFSATCQQSVNTAMQRQKGLGPNQKQQMVYEYVIVDEAARVSPRDLMIPMSQGKRIILVGDHRQLPHIVDESVAQCLHEKDAEKLLAKESEIQRDEENWSKISLFEHMFVKRIPELEKNDDIRRRVTLDRQFRMHPLLGDFISRNFYERFDASERFGSGRPAEDFTHCLPGTDDKAAIWLNVPASIGKHQRKNTSWIRAVEASAISKQLKAWMHSDAGKDLSFGVISFYKAQAELIQKQLRGVSEDSKKLRVGTVDSFQGMEFDVVFLSMVRTHQIMSKKTSSEIQARRLYGHLCLYNRLNVAMSRQKKLLVVVGDEGLIHDGLSAEHIPGLVNFYELCKTEGKVIQCL